MSLSAGSKLGSYEVLAPIGTGGMGEVYCARDVRLGREVAIKVLPADSCADENRRRRFIQEARAASALNHPNIVTIYEIDCADGIDFIVMEYVAGKTLDALIRPGMRLSDALRIAIPIADALGRAHTAGIVHRDLKPSNVAVNHEGVVKVLDFGLAKVVAEDEPSDGGEATTEASVPLSRPGTLAGTPGYMSPEQATGGTVATRSDIFSFGALLYEMVTGRRAFARDSRAATLAAVVRDEPSAPSEFVRDLPKQLEKLILRCLRKEPERRFQHMLDVKVELQEIKEESDSAPPATTATVPMRRKRVLWSASVLAVTLAGGVAVLWPARSARPRIESLVVLPLKNDSGDPGEDYFADGMTEALITELARLGGLKRVIPRGSAMRYKGTNKSFREIARELNVDAVVTGAVLHSGDRVRITAQLIDPTTEEQLWFDLYERDVRDVLALQSEVTRAIAAGVKVKVTPHEQARLASTRRVNPQAHEAYLRGRHGLGMLTPALAKEAVDHFQEAVEKDPGYAPAYSGLADAHFLVGWWGSFPPRQSLPKAKEAALQALEIDESLAEAHLSLAQVMAYYEWDWRSAEREHKKAIELDPGYPDGHRTYALLLSRLGRHEEARAAIERAQQLDPLSLQVNDHAAWVAWMARDYDRALQRYRKTLEMDPNYSIAHKELAWVYAAMGAHAQALEMAERAVQLSPDVPSLASLARLSGLAGRRENALKILRQLMDRKKREYVAPIHMASVYMGLDQKDQAFEWLDKAYDDRNLSLVNLKTQPIYDPLRSDRRFQDLLRRMNFPP